jgi:hypothetical protein
MPHDTTRGLTKCSQDTYITNFLKQDGNACSKRTCSCSQTPLNGSQSAHTLTICIIQIILSCNCLPYSKKHNSRVIDDSTCSTMLSPDQSHTKNDSLFVEVNEKARLSPTEMRQSSSQTGPKHIMGNGARTQERS